MPARGRGTLAVLLTTLAGAVLACGLAAPLAEAQEELLTCGDWAVRQLGFISAGGHFGGSGTIEVCVGDPVPPPPPVVGTDLKNGTKEKTCKSGVPTPVDPTSTTARVVTDKIEYFAVPMWAIDPATTTAGTYQHDVLVRGVSNDELILPPTDAILVGPVTLEVRDHDYSRQLQRESRSLPVEFFTSCRLMWEADAGGFATVSDGPAFGATGYLSEWPCGADPCGPYRMFLGTVWSTGRAGVGLSCNLRTELVVPAGVYSARVVLSGRIGGSASAAFNADSTYTLREGVCPQSTLTGSIRGDAQAVASGALGAQVTIFRGRTPVFAIITQFEISARLNARLTCGSGGMDSGVSGGVDAILRLGFVVPFEFGSTRLSASQPITMDAHDCRR